MKEIKPINDKILIELIPEETVTAGGLYVPDTVKSQPTKGCVKALGDGIEVSDGTKRPIPLEIGDKVLFYEGRGIDVKLEDNENNYKVISIKDVIGTYTD